MIDAAPNKTLILKIFSKRDLTEAMKIALRDRKFDDLTALSEEEEYHGMTRETFCVEYNNSEEENALINVFGQAFNAGWGPRDSVVLMDNGEVTWILEE